MLQGVQITSAKAGQSSSTLAKRAGLTALALALALTTTACLQNGSGKGTKTKLTTSTSGTTQSGGVTRIFYLRHVLRSQAGGGLLDLVGSEGGFGRWCASTDPSDPNGPSSCKCKFDYRDAGSSTWLSAQSETRYRESDLLRCATEGVPGTASEIRVSVVHAPTNQASNIVGFSLTFNGESGDYMNPGSYATAHRHQCQKSTAFPLLLGGPFSAGGINDPFLTRDPAFTLLTNHYASNLGLAKLTYAENEASKPKSESIDGDDVISGYLCPFEEESRMVSRTGTAYDSLSRYDYRIFSRGQGAGAPVQRIFPPDPGAFNTMSFKLATKPMGYFDEPVRASFAPGMLTLAAQPANGAAPGPGEMNPIGYAVKPARQLSAERCPTASEVPLPPNHRWVKLWLARAFVPKRLVKASGKLRDEVNGLVCNPGIFRNTAGSAAPNAPVVFQSCGSLSTADDRSLESSYLTPTTYRERLTDRVLLIAKQSITPANDLASGVCLGLQSGTGMAAGRFPAACSGSGVGCAGGVLGSHYAEGSDLYVPVSRNESNLQSCNGGQWKPGTNVIEDYMNVCSGRFHDPQNASTPTYGYGAALADNGMRNARGTDWKKAPVDMMLDAEDSEDHLFFVTPASVTYAQLTTDTPEARRYLPTRLKKAGSCPVGSAADEDCMDTENRLNYGIVEYQIGTSGSAGGANHFPLCVVQDTRAGGEE